jgi:hypothetical protein
MAPETSVRRIAVILGPGGSSRALLELLLPLLGRDRSIEMQGVFLEEAGLQHAAELPFVKELCRVTFSVREFTSSEFERALALRMRSARRALDLLAKRTGVAHSFRNVRGSVVRLLVETANTSDITLFEPARVFPTGIPDTAAAQRAPRPIVVALGDPAAAPRILQASAHLAGGDWRRISVLLTASGGAEISALNQAIKELEGTPGRLQALPGADVGGLAEAAQRQNAAMLVIGASEELLSPAAIQTLRERLRCPICVVRQWDDGPGTEAPE